MCTKNADVRIYVSLESSDEDGDILSENCIEETAVGAFSEPRQVLGEKQERLMNGSLYKIRAIVKRRVRVPNTKQPEDGTKDSVAESAHQVEKTGEAEREDKEVETEYYVLDDMAGDIIRANKED